LWSHKTPLLGKQRSFGCFVLNITVGVYLWQRNFHGYELPLHPWCEQNVCALIFFFQMWQHFRLLRWFGI
jgi:hypothetical protein